jgi:antitoxin (DNA-binding transcriptional repressor) of toxin-antitoxin stability system
MLAKLAGGPVEATMHEAKTQLSKLVARALAGEEVILTRGRKRVPAVKLVAVEPGIPAGEIRSIPVFKNGKRPIGLYKGQIGIGPEFFDPLPEEELALWEGNDNDSTLLETDHSIETPASARPEPK